MGRRRAGRASGRRRRGSENTARSTGRIRQKRRQIFRSPAAALQERFIFQTPFDPVDNEPDPNHTAISKPAIRQIVQNINDSIALPIPIIETKFIEGSDEVQMTLQNNYTGFSSVVIRYKTGGDPSETDPEASFPITGSGNDVYYFRAFPGEGATNKPSPSAVINMADYKVATPTYSFDDATDTISFACSTYGATMRLTTNGTEPSATNGELYTAAIKLTNATSFKVKGIKDGLCAFGYAFRNHQ